MNFNVSVHLADTLFLILLRSSGLSSVQKLPCGHTPPPPAPAETDPLIALAFAATASLQFQNQACWR